MFFDECVIQAGDVVREAVAAPVILNELYCSVLYKRLGAKLRDHKRTQGISIISQLLS